MNNNLIAVLFEFLATAGASAACGYIVFRLLTRCRRK